MAAELRLHYARIEDLREDHQQNLRKGRAFVLAATGPAERQPCRLALVHPSGAVLVLEAEVVWVKREAPGAGVGVQVRDWNDAAREALRLFVETAAAAPLVATPAPQAEPAPPAEPPGEDAEPTVDDAEPRSERRRPEDAAPRNLYERIRGLSLRERETMARQGTLPERIALERTFGSVVWEGLLQNPLLTPPEVAKIAKNGSLPRPVVAVVVQNAGWLKNPEVQRALLGNPRVSGADLDRVLRLMTRADLDRVASLTAYRSEVRQAAKKLSAPR